LGLAGEAGQQVEANGGVVWVEAAEIAERGECLFDHLPAVVVAHRPEVEDVVVVIHRRSR
jgi:hypothetical protein